MSDQDFATSFTVDQTPKAAFAAISLRSLIATGKGHPNEKA